MKSGTIDHPKMKMLTILLGIPHYASVGLMESLWHFTSAYAQAGDIGKFTNQQLCVSLNWTGDPDVLVDALIACRWVEKHDTFRLVIHDWAEHADDAVNLRLARKGLSFWCGKPASTKRLSKEEREKLVPNVDESVRTASARNAHGKRTASARRANVERTECAPPSPKPSPSPDIKSTSFESETSKPVRIVLDKRQWVYTGITDDDWKRWESAYPDVDLQREIAASIVWARDNPAKARKTNWGKFLSGWFSRTQGSTPKKQRAPDEFENTFDENHPMFDKVNQLLAEKAEQDAKGQGEIFGT